MASTSVESKSSGSTINLSSTELQEIIAQAVCMAGNASLSTALSVLPGKSQTWLFDSACCNHMTPHSSLFSKLDPAPHPLNIHIADGSTSMGIDPRTGQELGTGPRVGRMFPVSNLHLPLLLLFLLLLQLLQFLPYLLLHFSILVLVTHHLLGYNSTSQQNGRAERNFVIFLTLFVLCFFLPKFLPHFGSHEHNKLEPRLDSVVSLVMVKLKRDESLVPSTNTFDPPLDFSPNIFDASPRQVADEQIDDELPHFETGSPAPTLPEDPPQDIPPRHSTRIAMKEELDALTKTILGTWFLSLLDSLWLVVSGSIRSRLALMDPLSATRLVLLPKALHRNMGLIMKRLLLQLLMDVKNAFLNGDLSEAVYMQPPPGLSVESNKWHSRTQDFLSQQFEMKDLGYLSYSWVLKYSFHRWSLYYQAKYASDLLSQAGLTDSKNVDTPVELNAHLTPSGGKHCPILSLYRRLVSQYLSAPRSTHYAAVLRILRYLKGTIFHGLFYSAQSPLALRAFSDADWAGDPTDRRSTTGYCFLLGSSLISWESAIHIAHNDVFHERTKHIEIDCHFIRYHLVHGALKLFFVSSKDQLADIFTKSLPTRRTRDLIDNLKLVSHPP
ncbi:Retrovirus-related Pol polyprotein from transposon RE2 [Vitis vinifera]|uniref:Retrovirus-related Pol polyprotein from transposon RE2 n=1 Tax=Vitis vinifera TaxID=29760 RepID=A0A438GZ38_VITVI|nr:Retrovirus-related Pol polyprotein from transposon RE2 [Vitis vinifera]